MVVPYGCIVTKSEERRIEPYARLQITSFVGYSSHIRKKIVRSFIFIFFFFGLVLKSAFLGIILRQYLG